LTTNRNLSEMSTEELEAAAQEAREELNKLSEDEWALAQDASDRLSGALAGATVGRR
jgi:hypothetical protein